MLTEMVSALNYKDCDRKYVLVHAPENCLKLGWTTGFSPISICLRCCLCEKTVLNNFHEISRFRIV